MKKYFMSGLTLATLITSGTAAANFDLEDNYIGGSDPRDVIGSSSIFDIQGLNASLSGSILTVDIFTNFAGEADEAHFPGLTQTEASGWGNGIGYGDLFLSDDNAIGGWEYGVSLDNRWSATGGTADLYSITGSLASNDPVDFLMSDDFLSAGTFRNGHEVAVDLDNPHSSAQLRSSGSWSVDETAGSISFAIDLAGTGLPFSRHGIRFGWGETCANDVIQGIISMDDLEDGATSVPEPGALSLVGLGLIGTMVGRRRRKTA